eukprot:g1659.t1
MVEKGIVTSLEALKTGGIRVTIEGAEKKIVTARRVIVATGPTSIPRWPDWCHGLKESAPDGAIEHAWTLVQGNLATGIINKDMKEPNYKCTWHEGIKKETRILIVGGGLTSAHLLHNAVKHLGCRHVTLITRNRISVKQFDLSVNWVAWSSRPKNLHKFFKADMNERRTMLAQARGRGSISPEGMLMIRAAQELAENENKCELNYNTIFGGVREGFSPGSDVRVLEETTVECAMWLDDDECWEVYFSSGEIEHFDRIWLATGSEMNVTKDPLLGSLLQQRPIETNEGLPVLEKSLRWRNDTEVYVMGPMAALRLGPDSLNLAGGKTGSCRIDSAIRESFRSEEEGRVDIAKEEDRVAIANEDFAIDQGSKTLENISVKLNKKSGWCSVSLQFQGQLKKEVRSHDGIYK